jgi:hypothetical protein
MSTIGQKECTTPNLAVLEHFFANVNTCLHQADDAPACSVSRTQLDDFFRDAGQRLAALEKFQHRHDKLVSGFLPLLESARKTSGQVFMTCTEENWPRELGGDLQRWHVKAGVLQKAG